jgi:hypothetical protein
MFNAPAVPVSLLRMGWTNYPGISHWSGLATSVVFGYSILCFFISTYQHVIDSYEMYVAPALASLTLIRHVAEVEWLRLGVREFLFSFLVTVANNADNMQ